MKNLVLSRLALLSVFALSLSLGACKDPGEPNSALKIVRVSPKSITIRVGTQIKLSAEGIYEDEALDPKDLTERVDWTSNDPSIADFDLTAEPGTLVAHALGTVEIQAVDPVTNKKGTSQITVTDATIMDVQIELSPNALAAGTSANARAFVIYTDGKGRSEVTTMATWSTVDSGVAVVSDEPGQKGTVIGINEGETLIEVDFQGSRGKLPLRVTSGTLLTIDVSASRTEIPLGAKAKLTAIGNYSNGISLDITSSVVWSSSAPAVADVVTGDATSGTISGLQKGDATFTATDPLTKKAGTVAVKIGNTEITDLVIESQNGKLPVVAIGETLPLQVRVFYSDGVKEVITNTAVWTSASNSIATVNPTAVLRGVAAGRTQVTATFGGVSASVEVETRGFILNSIVVQSSTTQFRLSDSIALTATAHYSNGTTADVTSQVTWSQGSGSAAYISNIYGQKGVIFATSGHITGSVVAKATMGTVSSANFPIQLTAVSASSCSVDSDAFVAMWGPKPAGSTYAFRIPVSCPGSTKLYYFAEAATWRSTNPSAAVVSDQPGTKGVTQFIQAGSTTLSAEVPGTSFSFNFGQVTQ